MGCAPAESQKIAVEIDVEEDDASRDKYCNKHDAEVIFLKSSNAPAAKITSRLGIARSCRKELPSSRYCA